MKRTTLGWVLIGGIVLYIVLNATYTNGTKPAVYQAEAHEVELKPALVRAETEQEKIVRRIKETFPEEPRMLKVAYCESGWDSDGDGEKELHVDALNTNTDGTTDRGAFQLNSIHGFEGNLFDLDTNLKHARTLYERNGLQDWMASAHCWSK